MKFISGGVGDWVEDGCSLADETDGVVTCECNHLTNFGILVVRQYGSNLTSI